MPDGRRTTCQDCKGHVSTVGPISWNGLCDGCGVRRNEEAMTSLHYHRGPVFEHWRVRIAASVGAVIPEKG